MAFDERQKSGFYEGQHTLVLENRQKLSLSGVSDVESFDERSVVLFTSQGVLSISGEGLHINKLSIDNGEVDVEGDIYGLEYIAQQQGQRGGFFSRLFK